MKYLILGKDSFVGKYLAKKLPEAELCPEYINTVQDVLNVMDGRTDTFYKLHRQNRSAQC